MKNAQVFYCPSERNEQEMYNTATNPWPPGSDGNPTMNGWCGYGCRPDVEIPDDMSTAPPNFALPKLRQYHNEAILADLTAIPDRVTTRHGKGINVLYGSGGAHWVERSLFDDQLKQCPAIAATANPFQDEIFRRLDTSVNPKNETENPEMSESFRHDENPNISVSCFRASDLMR